MQVDTLERLERDLHALYQPLRNEINFPYENAVPKLIWGRAKHFFEVNAHAVTAKQISEALFYLVFSELDIDSWQ